MGEPHRPVDKRPDFPAIEQRVLAQWREGRVFERSLAARADGPVFSFSEGPPTANGDPGSHHVLLRSFKEAKGYYRRLVMLYGSNELTVDVQLQCHLLGVDREHAWGDRHVDDVVQIGEPDMN